LQHFWMFSVAEIFLSFVDFERNFHLKKFRENANSIRGFPPTSKRKGQWSIKLIEHNKRRWDTYQLWRSRDVLTLSEQVIYRTFLKIKKILSCPWIVAQLLCQRLYRGSLAYHKIYIVVKSSSSSSSRRVSSLID